MIKLKTKEEIEILREGGQRLAQILQTLKAMVRPGLVTAELDDKARELIKELGDEAAFLNYRPDGSALAYPATLCVSVNEEIVHGLPGSRQLNNGDLVSLDLGLKHRGLFTDAAITVPVGEISAEAKRLLWAGEEGLAAAIEAIKLGGTLGDIGAAVEAVAKKHRLGLIKDLAGHGVGYAVHEEPYVPNYGRQGKGEKIESGLVIAIEPMFTLGRGETKLERDGFTFSSADKSLAVHVEHTVAVTEEGVEVLTAL